MRSLPRDREIVALAIPALGSAAAPRSRCADLDAVIVGREIGGDGLGAVRPVSGRLLVRGALVGALPLLNPILAS